VIHLENITKRYAGHDALQRLTLDVDAGEMVFVTGHSGAGKSTLLKLIALIERDGKPRYHAFLPRQLDILARNLREPAVAGMAGFIAEVAPHITERAR